MMSTSLGVNLSAEELNRLAEQGYVLDHEYTGNMCSGFGGTLECTAMDPLTRERCRKGPGRHYPVESKRSKGWAYTDLTLTPKHYRGRHLLEIVAIDGWKQHIGRRVRCPGCDRTLVLVEPEGLGSLPASTLLRLPCGCKAPAYYLRVVWVVKNLSGDPR